MEVTEKRNSALLPPPPPPNRIGFWRPRKISAATPPPLNRVDMALHTKGGPLFRKILDLRLYLGIELDNKLCWKQQVTNVRSKGTRTLNMVRRNFTKGTKPDTRNQIYTSLVRPVLEYGSLLWDPYQHVRIQQIEAVQNKAARYVHQDWQRTSSVTAMKDSLGWLPLQNRRLVNRLTFMHKTAFMDNMGISYHLM